MDKDMIEIKYINESHTEVLENNIDDKNVSAMMNIISISDDYEVGEDGSAYGLFLNDRLIGAVAFGMLDEVDGEPYIISGIVIFSRYKGNGYAKHLLKEAFIMEVGSNYNGYLHADVLDNKLDGFYYKLGFIKISDFEHRKRYG